MVELLGGCKKFDGVVRCFHLRNSAIWVAWEEIVEFIGAFYQVVVHEGPVNPIPVAWSIQVLSRLQSQSLKPEVVWPRAFSKLACQWAYCQSRSAAPFGHSDVPNLESVWIDFKSRQCSQIPPQCVR